MPPLPATTPPMAVKNHFLPSHFIYSIFFLCFLLLPHDSHQLPTSQSHALLTIQKLLNYPSAIIASSSNTRPIPDFCNMEPNPSMTIVCYDGNISQVHFHGFVDGLVPPLPKHFSIVALFHALSRLPHLKVLTLVSMGLWGPLPGQYIRNCSSLEILNLSSNFLIGTIPVELFELRNLQTLVLDHNLLTGQVPDGYFNSHHPLPLAVLSIKSNTLNGSLPTSLSTFTNLRILQLSENNFTGDVPDLTHLTNLHVLDLGDNSFGPQFPSFHNKLVTLVLRKNKFRFGMIQNITSYYHLQKLDVSSNELVGPFYPAMLSLPSIGYVDISTNRLTGMLQENMTCGTDLKFVDLSANFLTGNLPSCLLVGRSKRIAKYRWNCLSNKGYERQHRIAFCRNEALAVRVMHPHPKTDGSATPKSVLAMGMVGGISVLGLGLLVVGIVFSRYQLRQPSQTRTIMEKATFKYTTKQLQDAREICQMVKIGPLGLPPYRKFPLEELKDITANFDNTMIIGQGSLGPIYKGKLTNDTAVAIRSLKVRKKRGIHTYTHQIEILAKLRHSNLVSTLGHCFECHPDDSTINRIHLIFEFVPNGNLRDCLAGENLGWPQRIVAVTSVAKGIQFLQTGIMPGLYSNNIKITDVLLDHNLHVKISSYNLPLLTENREQVDSGDIHFSGTKETLKEGVKEHERTDDVYDFGVILLEVILGRPIASENEVQIAKDVFEVGLNGDEEARSKIIDPAISNRCSHDSLKTVMDLCIKCLSSEPSDRPSIEDVLWHLSFAAQVQDSWQGDSPSNSNSRNSPTFTSP